MVGSVLGGGRRGVGAVGLLVVGGMRMSGVLPGLLESTVDVAAYLVEIHRAAKQPLRHHLIEAISKLAERLVVLILQCPRRRWQLGRKGTRVYTAPE